ncbi:MAG TPA: hypothetical protein VKA06_04020, partial [Spirochaetia bacterium]|nr:hypothetical protein [Spirochaetia bacterium]
MDFVRRDQETAPRPFWLQLPTSGETFAAFRARFDTISPDTVAVESSGSGPYTIWIDGAVVQEGPVRAKHGISALAEGSSSLDAGRHTVGILCHHEGVATRIIGNLPAHMRCALAVDSVPLALDWRGTNLGAYETGVRRINPELGWTDWCDTSLLPVDWRTAAFDDSDWPSVREVELQGWSVVGGGIGSVSFATDNPVCIAEGYLAERYGYEKDDPPARFLLRELTSGRIVDDRNRLPSQGVWRRYDIGVIGLVRPRVQVDVPAGTVIEVGYCEELHEGRVNPFVTLSL